MKISTIDLQQLADTIEAMDNRQLIESGRQFIFIGQHPDCHGFTIAFQHGATDEATILQIDESDPLLRMTIDRNIIEFNGEITTI